MSNILKVVLLSVTTLFVVNIKSIGQSQADSLWGIWEDESKADTLRAKSLYNFIWNIYTPDSMIRLADMLYQFSESNNLKVSKGNALYVKGYVYFATNEIQKSIDTISKSISIFESQGNLRYHAHALNLLAGIHTQTGDYQEAIDYSDQAYQLADRISDKDKMRRAINQTGKAHRLSGNYNAAVDYFNRFLKMAKEDEVPQDQAEALRNLGAVHQSQSNFPAALSYYKRSLNILEQGGSVRTVIDIKSKIAALYSEIGEHDKAIELNKKLLEQAEDIDAKYTIMEVEINMANSYSKLGQHDVALSPYLRALSLAEEIGSPYAQEIVLSNLGNTFEKLKNLKSAKKYYEKALEISETLGNKSAISLAMSSLGRIHLKQNRLEASEVACTKALEIAKEINAWEAQRQGCKCLSELYIKTGDGVKAIDYHKQAAIWDDSLRVDETAKKLQQMEFAKQVLADSLAQVEKDLRVEMSHQAEVRKKDKNRNIAIGAGIFFLVLAAGIFSRLRYIKRSKGIIEKEKDRSDNLLLNILPAEIAEELKEKGESTARNFDDVSILFTDFKGFTQASETLSPADLVAEINTCFKAFDGIVEKYNIEKIKTIGDAYMCAGGLPIPDKKSLKNTVLAGLEMQAYIVGRKAQRDIMGLPAFEMRVGIHTGSVIAGIVGVKKFQYDVWGDTVNTASRMESHGEIGTVNISQTTYDSIKEDDQFKFEHRGKLEVKGKGEMDMYFVGKNTS